MNSDEQRDFQLDKDFFQKKIKESDLKLKEWNLVKEHILFKQEIQRGFLKFENESLKITIPKRFLFYDKSFFGCRYKVIVEILTTEEVKDVNTV